MPTFTRAAREAALRLLANAGDSDACLVYESSPYDDFVRLRCRPLYEHDTVAVIDSVRLIDQFAPGPSVVLDFSAHGDGRFKVLRERDELEFTPTALETAQKLLAATDDPNACLRYNAHVGSGNCSWGKSIAISLPHWQDTAFHVRGMKVVVDWRSMSYLQRYLVDWSERDQKFTFTFRPR